MSMVTGRPSRCMSAISSWACNMEQQQQQDEKQAYLWFCLSELKGYISDEAFALAERDLGLTSQEKKQ